MSEDWQDVRLNIERPGAVDTNGPCANYMARNDYKGGRLSRGTLQYSSRGVVANAQDSERAG